MKKNKKEKRDKNAQITHENAAKVQTAAAETIAPPTPTQAAEIDIWQKNINDFEQGWQLWTKEAKAEAQPVMVREAYRTRNGAVYFEYADLGRIPVVRSLELNKLLLKLRFCITPDYITQLKNEILKAIGDGDEKRVLALNKDFFDRADVAPEIPTMTELAAIFFIRHDENPYTFNPIIHAQKLKAAQTDYNLQAFFLHASWDVMQQTDKDLLKIWQIGSEDAFRDYLQGKIPTRAKTN
jgi:hypothetical protein